MHPPEAEQLTAAGPGAEGTMPQGPARMPVDEVEERAGLFAGPDLQFVIDLVVVRVMAGRSGGLRRVAGEQAVQQRVLEGPSEYAVAVLHRLRCQRSAAAAALGEQVGIGPLERRPVELGQAQRARVGAR